jgi:hypothetical protein
MTANFIESVGRLRATNADGLQNVVRTVQYKIVCEYLGERLVNMFDVELPPPDLQSFVSFNNLTQLQVLGWVKESLGQQDIENRKNAMKTMIEQIVAAKEIKPQEIASPWN